MRPLKRWNHRFARLGDVNGDGMSDLVQCTNPTWDEEGYSRSEGKPFWSVHLWVPSLPGTGGPGFDPSPITLPLFDGVVDCAEGLDEVYVADVDGDGASEILGPQNDKYYGALRFQNGAWLKIETKLQVQPSHRRIHFLDVNGDGLSDAIYSGYGYICPLPGEHACPWIESPGWPWDVPFEALNGGKGFTLPSDTVPESLAAPSWRWTDWYGDEAVTLDYDGDGRMDLLMPIYGRCDGQTSPAVGVGDGGGSSDPCWVVLPSSASVEGYVTPPKGGPIAGDKATVDTHIPLVYNSDTGVAYPWFLPQVTDVDGDGRHDFVMASPSGDGTFTVFKNSGPQDLLVAVTDGMNALDPGDPGFLPTVSITYGNLVDYARTLDLPAGSALAEAQTYLSRSDPANGCVYPRACTVGTERVVSAYALNDGQNEKRSFTVLYRDGRYHRLGRGSLGFGARIVLDDGTGSGSADFFDNVTQDPTLDTFPFAGQVVRSWAWSPASASQPKPTQIELTYGRTMLQEIPTIPGTYFTLAVITQQTREEGTFKAGPSKTLFDYVQATETTPATVLGHTHAVVSNYDTYGNVLAQDSYADGVDLHDSVDAHRHQRRGELADRRGHL